MCAPLHFRLKFRATTLAYTPRGEFASLTDPLGQQNTLGYNLAATSSKHAIRSPISAHAIDLIVMGAHGHSKIRQFLVGSITTRLIRQSKIPLLLLR